MPHSLSPFFLTAFLTVFVVGLVGNAFIFAIVGKLPKMKIATKYLVLNLAVADHLVIIFCLIPSLISNIYVPWVMGSLMCKIVPYIQGVSVCASVYSLAAISVDRLMAIRSPLRRQVTEKMARRIIGLVWIRAAGLAFPWLVYFDLSNTDGSNRSLVFCIEGWPSAMYGNTYFVVVNLGLCYLVPLGFISFCHSTIWLRVRRPQLPTNASMSQRQLVHNNAKASVQKLVIVVVLAFAACWLPLYVICIRIKLIPTAVGATEEQVLDYAVPIAQWLGAANSCINPILYVIFNRDLRFSLTSLLPGFSARTKPRNRPNPQHHERPIVGSLSVALHRSPSRNSQLKNSCQNGVDFSDEYIVINFHHKNPNLATITRSHTHQTPTDNPWSCFPMKSACVA